MHSLSQRRESDWLGIFKTDTFVKQFRKVSLKETTKTKNLQTTR